MSNQFGFDFGGDIASTFAEHAPGAWLDPDFTVGQYLEIFAKADVALLPIAGPGRALFGQGIEAAKAQLAAMLENRERDDTEEFSLWRSNFKPKANQLAAFVEHCISMGGSSFPGIEYKTRREASMTTAAMFVQDIGTIIVRAWENDNVGIDYHPWRDSFFMESYRDTIGRLAVPYSTWGGAYCADKIAYSGDGIASVPTFTVNGREYINDGSLSRGSYRECEGWSFCAPEDWRGPTFSYSSQCRAWDDGRTERGDRRGLVVRVRGKLCVVDGVSVFYDDHAEEIVLIRADEDEEIDEDDAEIETDELAELEA